MNIKNILHAGLSQGTVGSQMQNSIALEEAKSSVKLCFHSILYTIPLYLKL